MIKQNVLLIYFFGIANTILNYILQTVCFIPIVLIGFCTFFALLLKTPKTLAVKNRFRKNWIIVLFHLVLTGIIILLINNRNTSELLFIFFPTAIILANGIELIQKKWLADAIFFIFLTLSFVHFFS